MIEPRVLPARVHSSQRRRDVRRTVRDDALGRVRAGCRSGRRQSTGKAVALRDPPHRRRRPSALAIARPASRRRDSPLVQPGGDFTPGCAFVPSSPDQWQNRRIVRHDRRVSVRPARAGRGSRSCPSRRSSPLFIPPPFAGLALLCLAPFLFRFAIRHRQSLEFTPPLDLNGAVPNRLLRLSGESGLRTSIVAPLPARFKHELE